MLDEPPTGPTLVTGALGNVGSQVVARLIAAGRTVRAADLDGERIRAAFGDQVEIVRFDFTDPSTWVRAFSGVETMFLMRPPALGNVRRDLVPALEAARGAGVRHFVVLSLQGAEHNRFVPHAAMEDWARHSGADWTFVRPSFFMENLSGTHASDIRDRDEIFVPAGDGATSFVAASDVAAVAAAALLDPAAHSGRAWTPTGPEDLTYSQVAGILTTVLGRPIRYAKPGALRYLVHASRRMRMPSGMVAVTTAIYTVARLGKAAGLTDDVSTVTGRPPLAFREWAEQHRTKWARND